jgi:hypothetical protein
MTGFSADALALHGARYGSSPTTSSGQSPVGYAVKKATGRGAVYDFYLTTTSGPASSLYVRTFPIHRVCE